MTLFQKLMKGMFRILLFLFFVLFGVHIYQNQTILYSTHKQSIQNMLDMVNLTLTTHIENQDHKASQQAITAIFNTGEFQHLKVTMLHDQSVIEKSFSPPMNNTLEWLKIFNLFPAITDSRIISDGWSELARVEFTSDPQPSYEKMLKVILTYLGFSSIFFILTALLTTFYFSRTFRPLTQITKHAQEISNNKFNLLTPLANNPDLKSIQLALNQLTAQVKLHFEQQASDAKRARDNAFRDPISGLANRSLFINQLQSWLIESAIGGIIFIKHLGISEAYKSDAIEDAEHQVVQFANKLNTITSDYVHTTSRINNDEFAILLPNLNTNDLKQLGEYILDLIKIDLDSAHDQLPNFAIGIAENNPFNRESSVILSKVDSALRQAIGQIHPLVILSEEQQPNTMGKQEWKKLITQAVKYDWFNFKFQAAISDQNKILHYEVFSAIEHEGTYYSAARFLAAIEQLELGELFDRYVITRMIERLIHEPDLGPLSINLTQNSLMKPSFIRWLSTKLNQHSKLAGRLHFEIPERAFIRYGDHVSLLTEQISRYHFSFGVDNYGRHFKSLGYLSNFNPDFVKIDHVYTQDINDENQRHVLASICRTAHNLNIDTIATRVETEEQLEKLSELFVNGFQGYIFEK